MATTTQIGKLKCLWSRITDSKRVVYILYPMDSILTEWIDSAANRYGCSIAVVTGMDWDNDLTPWPAPGVPDGSPDFKGLAPEFLKTLQNELIPEMSRQMQLPEEVAYDLVGVSLSGLFALWQWMECDTFHSIACISGSFWYKDFVQWLSTQAIPQKSGCAYFSLGDQESKSPVKAFQSVATDTQSVISTLNAHGLRTEFRSVAGNHFQHPIERLEFAFQFLTGKS